MKRFYQWCARGWPFWAIFLVVGAHQGLLSIFPTNSESISETFSTGLQVIGGLLVLHSIDSSLGILRGESILRLIEQWVLACPVWNKPKPIQVEIGATSDVTASAHGRVKRQTTSLASRVDELERQVDEMYQEIGKREQALKKMISDTKEQLSERTRKNEATLRVVESKIDVTALGSIKQQVFGVVIAMYGAGIGYFS